MQSNARHLVKQAYTVARHLNINLDPALTVVDYHGDTVRVVATCNAFPRTDEERSLAHSALHVALHDALMPCVAPYALDVRVHVPPVAAPPPLPAAKGEAPPPAGATPPVQEGAIAAWLRAQAGGGDDLVRTFVATLARTAYQTVLCAYPWRERAAMQALVPALVTQALASITASAPDPVIYGNADRILLPLESVVSAFDADSVRRDVAAALGRQPCSLLELYEVVYARGTAPGCKPQTAKLHSVLFE